MRRAKQVIDIIDGMNTYFKYNGIVSTSDTTFVVFTDSLISANCYAGFVYKKDRYIGDELMSVTCREQEAEYIQIL